MKIISEFISGSLSLLKGMWITLKTMFKRPITVQYPDEKREMALRYRGRLVLPVDPALGGANRCTACMACVRACPNRSLEVTRVKEEGGKPRAGRFDYNLGSCMFCNLCVEACTFAAIVMSDDYETSTEDKAALQRELVGEKYVLAGKKAPWWQGKFRTEE